jgi:hypothetical protein
MLRGEADAIYSEEGVAKVAWSSLTRAAEADARLAWFKARIDLPAAPSPPAAQTAYALDLSSMNKGVAFVNGFDLGRYWMLPGKCSGSCAPPVKNGHCYEHWTDCGEPTQTLYHVPTELLRPTGNLVVLFEETANSVQPRRLERVRLVALHAHP